MRSKQIVQLLELARKSGVLRPRDLDSYGLSREVLRRMEKKGILQRVSRGLYILPEAANITEHHSLVEACKQTPHGVICLLSALAFHGFTTQAPFEVWMAISGKARRPKSDRPPMRFVRFSAASLERGVEEHVIEGVRVRVYDPAKTVADCFKYRNKIGLDVALEALRECVREHKATMDELWHYAQICRVEKVMKPYLEAIV